MTNDFIIIGGGIAGLYTMYNILKKRPNSKIILINESDAHALIWYDINYTKEKVDKDAMYFHAYHHRVPKTTLGVDYEILPNVLGKGRFIGSNVSVVGDSALRGTWFGEGEVKMYLDGDKAHPSLSGTQARSISNNFFKPPKKISSGTSGMHIRVADLLKRFKFSCGRKTNTSPFAERYPFIPSNIDWP
jgi:hypothetical protein